MKSYLVVLLAILGIANAYVTQIYQDDHIRCSGNEDEISGILRTGFLNMHNSYRSHLARERNASRMRRMEYDCDAEASAYESAEKCEDNASSHEKYDENLHVIDEEQQYHDPVLEAGNSWWSEVLDTYKNVYNSSINANFANMAWDTRERFGCAIFTCSKKHHVVCHYPKIEKTEGEQIYKIGDGPCSDCKDYNSTVTCDEELCSAIF